MTKTDITNLPTLHKFSTTSQLPLQSNSNTPSDSDNYATTTDSDSDNYDTHSDTPNSAFNNKPTKSVTSTTNSVTYSDTKNCVTHTDIKNYATKTATKNNFTVTATDYNVLQTAKFDPAPSLRHFSTTSQFPSHFEQQHNLPKTTPLPQSQTLLDNVFTPTIKTVTTTEPYKHHLAADKNGHMRKYYDLSDIRPSKTTEQVVEFEHLNYHNVTEPYGSVTKYYDLSDPLPKTKMSTHPRLTKWTLSSAK